MRSVERSGRTVDEAVLAALEELGVPSDRVTIEVLDEGKGGFLGIGARPAVVRVTVKENRAERVEAFLADVCEAMGIGVRIETREDGEYIYVDVTGQEAGILIGHHGQTLDALQYLCNLVAGRSGQQGSRIVLDVEGYRRRRTETLTTLATRLAERVVRSGEPAVLEPMSAQERRVIHLALQDYPGVTTTSEGQDPFRRVVIQKKG
ncbi:spoIIIJ-associated protein [Symbiobacterium terraclitae]|uniref:RNA-binding protein KhpB n=1 Tax=Symbiobacterium terraclitae TaxID=557451 RepID=A0ABS4JVB5_9FIRM|nr:RNA-binding cell elongation regulator Jag/EloR [Symbiobacterium terraclitae]MBP2019499.1 spoIIIJ-associated protein [Symbiobacterium terraclitae]